MHDLLREVAIQKAKEDNFLTIFSEKDTRLGGSYSTRRLVLDNCGNMPLEHASTNLRSMNYFGDIIPNCSGFKMLRVLNGDYKWRWMCTSLIQNYEIKWLKTLIALRYFGFDSGTDCCRYKFRTNKTYIKVSSLTYMKNLQTVCLSMVCPRSDGELPSSFWDNKLLRHVIFGPCKMCKRPPEGPPSSADLQNLLTLKWVTARQEWGTKLPHFPHLRKLGVKIPNDVDGDPIVNSLSNLQGLGFLGLRTVIWEHKKPSIFLGHSLALGTHERLYSLSLGGNIWAKQGVVDGCSMFPPHLVKLTLYWFRFEEDPMALLQKLPNLTVLRLDGRMRDENKRMICSRGGFGSLRQLELDVYDLVKWGIEEGTMPLLNQLKLYCHHSMHVIPDLQYLTSLRQLELADLNTQLESSLKGDERWRIKHIPSVTLRSSKLPISLFVSSVR
jgi:hypothetical protein